MDTTELNQPTNILAPIPEPVVIHNGGILQEMQATAQTKAQPVKRNVEAIRPMPVVKPVNPVSIAATRG